MSAAEKIKACPSCESEVDGNECPYPINRSEDSWRISCPCCSFSITADDRRLVVDTWNVVIMPITAGARRVLSAPTGQPPRRWTAQERADVLKAMQDIHAREDE